MDDALLSIVFERLDEAGLDPGVSDLVIAAVDSDEAVADAIDGAPPERPTLVAAAPVEPAAVWLGALTVEGFRGIGPKALLGLTPGPGLTLVAGRNGSGKSSFAEALELLLTGDTVRWAGKGSKDWQSGWRNLHTTGPTILDLQVFVDQTNGPSRVTRRWDAGAELDSTAAEVRHPGSPPAPVGTLGWEAPLAMYRPFLSHDELGGLLAEGPSKLYDAMAQILGLDDLVRAVARLAEARTARARTLRSAKTAAGALRDMLEAAEGPRVKACLDSLPTRGNAWDVDALEAVLAADAGALDSTVAGLEALTTAAPPDVEVVTAATLELRQAVAAVTAVAGTDAEEARSLAGLLDAALAFHDAHAVDDCPVCGATGRLTGDWRAHTTAEVERLRERARTADEAHTRLRAARQAAHRLLTIPPLPTESGLDLDEAEQVIARWNDLAELDDPVALADAMDDTAPLVAVALEEAAAAARERLAEHQQAWWPIAERLTQWLPQARAALAGQTRAADITAAETWLKQLTDDLRDERFAPIAGQVKALWETLSPATNVNIDDVTLDGAATRRRVAIDVSVDGTPGAALGVMSQGELHAMALALFLPRATLPASPFRFLVIDDPVQAMDPARVDGLARVLAHVATTRQVVVFTHDDRLADAVRRLQLPARILEVRRADQSNVTVALARSPVDAALDDAGYLLSSASGAPDEVRQRVVPGLCRQAVEAACLDTVRRRRLARGDKHSDVEDLLTSTTKLLPRLALALFDDETRGGDVYGRVNSAKGSAYGDAVRAVNEGAHGKPVAMGLDELVTRSRTLADWIGSLS